MGLLSIKEVHDVSAEMVGERETEPKGNYRLISSSQQLDPITVTTFYALAASYQVQSTFKRGH